MTLCGVMESVTECHIVSRSMVGFFQIQLCLICLKLISKHELNHIEKDYNYCNEDSNKQH